MPRRLGGLTQAAKLLREKWLHGSVRDPRIRDPNYYSGSPTFPRAVHLTQEEEWAKSFALEPDRYNFPKGTPPSKGDPRIFEFEVGAKNPFPGELNRFDQDRLIEMIKRVYAKNPELAEELMKRVASAGSTGENALKWLSANPAWTRKPGEADAALLKDIRRLEKNRRFEETKPLYKQLSGLPYGTTYLSDLPKAGLPSRDTDFTQKALEESGYDSVLYRDRAFGSGLGDYIQSLAVFNPEDLKLIETRPVKGERHAKRK